MSGRVETERQETVRPLPGGSATGKQNTHDTVRRIQKDVPLCVQPHNSSSFFPFSGVGDVRNLLSFTPLFADGAAAAG